MDPTCSIKEKIEAGGGLEREEERKGKAKEKKRKIGGDVG